MAEQPKITIVTPAYNAEEFLGEAIESVQMQSFKNYEHIIVDDGSTDGTAMLIKQYAERDPRIIFLQQKNQGPSVARNEGIARATGEYITFLDADDLYSQETLSLAAKKMLNESPDIIFYDFVYYFGDMNPGPAPYKIDLNAEGVYTKKDIQKNIFNVFPILTCNKFIRSQILQDKRILFNKQYARYEDVDFSIRTTLAAQTYAYFDHVGYYYRLGRESSETATNYKHATQLLKILIELNKTIIKSYPNLKQSYDNYAIDQIIANINMQERHSKEQMEVFSFAKDKVIPQLGLKHVTKNYMYNENLFNSFEAVKRGDFSDLLRCRIELLKNHIDTQESTIKTLRADVQKTQADFGAYRDQSEHIATLLRQNIREIHESFSWRITRPLRVASRGAHLLQAKLRRNRL